MWLGSAAIVLRNGTPVNHRDGVLAGDDVGVLRGHRLPAVPESPHDKDEDAPARLITSSVRRNDGSPAARLKTLAYLDNVLARAQARERGADEALMLNSRGEAACAAAANVFWVSDGRLYTPALECGVLAGTMRARVLAAAVRLGVEVAEVRAPGEALAGAEAVFLTNSLIGLRAVSGLDEVVFGGSALVERLAAEVSA